MEGVIMGEIGPGAVVAAFPRWKTMGLPLVMFCVLALPVAPLLVTGAVALGAFFLFVIAGVFGLVIFGSYVTELMGMSMRVVGVHERGLMCSSAGEQFLPWASLTLRHDAKIMRPKGLWPVRQQTLSASSLERPIVLNSSEHGEAAMDFVALHLAVGHVHVQPPYRQHP